MRHDGEHFLARAQGLLRLFVEPRVIDGQRAAARQFGGEQRVFTREHLAFGRRRCDDAERLAAADPRVRVVHHESNQGFAAAYRSGLARARMQYVTFAPGDNEIAPTSLAEIFASVGKADLVVPYHGTPWKRAFYRRILTWTCVTQINVLFGWHLRYFQGPTVYPTQLARALPRTTRGFFFITEMLVYALAAGYTAVEVPLIHQERAYGRSKAVALSNIVDAERTILRLWWQIRLLGRRAPVVQDEVLQRV